MSEALLHQKTSLVNEFSAEGNRVGSDNAMLRAQLEQMHLNMNEMRQEMFNLRYQAPLSVGGNLGRLHDSLTPRRVPLPPSPIAGYSSEAFSLGLPQLVPPGPKRAPPQLPNGILVAPSTATLGNHGGDPPNQWPSSLRSPYDMSELPRPPVSQPNPETSPPVWNFNPGGGGG